MIAHQTDMHREADTTTGVGRAPLVERSSRKAAGKSLVPYAVSYPAEVRRICGLGKRLTMDGQIPASNRWNCLQMNHLTASKNGPGDAISGSCVGQDFAGVVPACLGVPRNCRIFATELRRCKVATVVSGASFPGLRRRS
jgi:hypothetical protein